MTPLLKTFRDFPVVEDIWGDSFAKRYFVTVLRCGSICWGVLYRRRIFYDVLLAGICWGVPIAVNILGCPQWVYAGVCLSP